MNEQIVRQNGMDRVGSSVEKTAAEGVQESLHRAKAQVETLISQRNDTLLGILDPRERARRIGEEALIKGEFEGRKEILRIYQQAQIVATKELVDHFLTKLKVHSRSELAVYVQEQSLRVQQETGRMMSEMIVMLESSWTSVQAISVPQVRERMIEHYNKQFDADLKLCDHLLENFRNAIKQHEGERDKKR